MNRSLNSKIPDILLLMIAEKQIRGERVREDKEDLIQRAMGPQKPATEMSASAGSAPT
ncbi:hypothetical protein BVC80_209g201 [Macleaya cordata]|uniref:Uncharacterized protein n=1 Tax=Macleaya cordata TaxID=56857 RepID=A0A200QDE9_MACCD|nr:hypothetical protein BVC80_209g201 [Macleaya cordata]